jgi:hydrogenase expression/formation protein HypD
VLEQLFADPTARVDGLLAAGHVCAVMGTDEYPPLCARFSVPIVVTGFEPADILEGVLGCVELLEAGKSELRVQYSRAVRPEGSPLARAAIERVFSPADRPWRGLGVVPSGGLVIREALARYDAARRFAPPATVSEESPACRAADVLRGTLRPTDCPEFGRGCTPERPLGAPMVSTEGACAAFHRYRPSARGLVR